MHWSVSSLLSTFFSQLLLLLFVVVDRALLLSPFTVACHNKSQHIIIVVFCIIIIIICCVNYFYYYFLFNHFQNEQKKKNIYQTFVSVKQVCVTHITRFNCYRRGESVTIIIIIIDSFSCVFACFVLVVCYLQQQQQHVCK